MADPFDKRTYYAITLDPVHIGTGGYRLGRVDNTITREPGTNLPKIPGSSISGATRAYTAMHPDIDKYPSCAGKGGEGGDSHCGEPDCKVCVPFGFSRKSGTSFQGLAQFFDARILFFPVHSMIGPVWVTSPSVISEFTTVQDINPEKFRAINRVYDKQLNFGWLMLNHDSPSKADIDLSFLNTCEVCKVIKERAYLVSDKLFSRIVNDNLEVRTSVAINPATGAAEDGALYTYEAIPRATVMWFDVVYNKPEYFRIDGQEISVDVQANVKKGLEYLKTLGVGGMNTRGMGRLNILNLGGR
ncbi:type III-B CRISPR module RAMP protein Cmr4 [candidate division WS5 bacterium]|uniref:Type III-B CRISPR module RAMP protein Cmr4 n=1 Tax=candidate division WS5 bacterium TaxID=2093353 RepID=A0A419DDW6_9BACT|nr:MAG: type III-B CRISPR module RAMP protein Cmr4 [candidate division WS5 bacterium]